MCEYPVPFIPGPTSVPRAIREVYLNNFGSADLEDEYFVLYSELEKSLQKLLNTKNQMIAMTGEGMVVLWGALKSVLKPGNKVLAISSGLFGDGFAEMAEAIQCEARIVRGEEGDQPKYDDIRSAALDFKPDLITFVMCETPAGILNTNIEDVSKVAKEVGSLLCVDFVSCAGAVPVYVDRWGIDLGLLGSQKCLSCIPDMAIASVSEKAWERIKEVNYQGYDAFLPFKDALKIKYFPFTPNWHGTAALKKALDILFEEGLENVFRRHLDVSKFVRNEVKKLGYKIYPVSEELSSPTVTAVYLPKGVTFEQLNEKLKKEGIHVGGTFGHLSGKIFRIGHMGSQANFENAQKLIDALKKI